MLPTETAETMETEFDFNLATQTRDVICMRWSKPNGLLELF
jgi:hypothetical protein